MVVNTGGSCLLGSKQLCHIGNGIKQEIKDAESKGRTVINIVTLTNILIGASRSAIIM